MFINAGSNTNASDMKPETFCKELRTHTFLPTLLLVYRETNTTITWFGFQHDLPEYKILSAKFLTHYLNLRFVFGAISVIFYTSAIFFTTPVGTIVLLRSIFHTPNYSTIRVAIIFLTYVPEKEFPKQN